MLFTSLRQHLRAVRRAIRPAISLAAAPGPGSLRAGVMASRAARIAGSLTAAPRPGSPRAGMTASWAARIAGSLTAAPGPGSPRAGVMASWAAQLGILLVLAALLLAAGGDASDGAEAGPSGGIRSIEVTESEHQIRYGEEIRFELRAESSAAQITEVQAFIKSVGPDTISEYSYAEFEPGEKVSAAFSIPTSGASFRPPGTRLDVHFVIRDADGNEFQTTPKRIEYLDPQFHWQRASKGRLSVIYHDRPASEITALLEAAERRLPILERTFGMLGDQTLRAVLVNSAREAEEAFPRVSETARRQHTFGGFAFDEFGLFVLWGADSRGFVHELTHLAFGQAVSSPLARKPAWLNEGLAVYFETLDRETARRRLRSVASREDLFPITSMNAVPGKRDDIAMFYAKAGSFAGFLMEEFGPDAMSRLLEKLNLGGDAEDAVKTVYGKALPELDAAWEFGIYGQSQPERAASDSGDTTPASEPTRDRGRTDSAVATQTPVSSPALPGTDAFPRATAIWLGLAVLGLLAAGLILWTRRGHSDISPE